MKQYLENRIAETLKELDKVHPENLVTEYGLQSALYAYQEILEEWNKQLQITDAEEAANKYHESLKNFNNNSIEDAYLAGWQAKTIQLAEDRKQERKRFDNEWDHISHTKQFLRETRERIKKKEEQLANISEEEIDGIVVKKWGITGSEAISSAESYRKGLIDMYNKLKTK